MTVETKAFRKRRGFLAVAVLVVTTVVGISLAATSDPLPTKGSIPEDAWLEDGSVDLAQLPDFIVALDGDGNAVGYVERSTLFPDDPTEEPLDGPNPVVDESLQRVIGHMVPGRGFVPVGTPFDQVPTIPVTIVEGPDAGD